MRLPLQFLLFAVLSLPLGAQGRLGPVERRPKLAVDADTNDANSYFALGSRVLVEKPAEAAQAFYWAARLDPSSAEALDGRRAALILRNAVTTRLFVEGGRRARESKVLRALDSLRLRALRLDPLYYRKYDQAIIAHYFRTSVRREYPQAAPADIEDYVREMLSSGPVEMRAWVEYGDGRFAQSLEHHEDAAKASKTPGSYRLERARILALQGLFPRAIAEFRLAAEALAKVEADRDEDVVFYNSRAILEHSLALSYGRDDQLDSARAALGRVIAEDLSYFMAHVELGRFALAAHDTATAVSELALAADLASDEPYVHYMHGSMLLAAGQATEAVAPLTKAIALEPFHSGTHFELALALEKVGDRVRARESFTRFLALAARRDVDRRRIAAERLAGLQQ